LIEKLLNRTSRHDLELEKACGYRKVESNQFEYWLFEKFLS